MTDSHNPKLEPHPNGNTEKDPSDWVTGGEAMILTQSDEIEAWMTAPWETAKALQRPLPDGALSVIDA